LWLRVGVHLGTAPPVKVNKTSLTLSPSTDPSLDDETPSYWQRRPSGLVFVTWVRLSVFLLFEDESFPSSTFVIRTQGRSIFPAVFGGIFFLTPSSARNRCPVRPLDAPLSARSVPPRAFVVSAK